VKKAVLHELSLSDRDIVSERRVRAYIGGAIAGLAANHISPPVCRRQLRAAYRKFRDAVHRGDEASWRVLYASLFDSVRECADADFYRRSEVADDNGPPGVTFQCADPVAMAAWTGSASETPIGLVRRVRDRRTVAGAMVGLSGRATWLAPFTGVIEDLVEDARHRPSPDAAKRVRDLIAQSAWKPGQTVVAFVSRSPLSRLSFELPTARRTATRPVGPTRLEAQTHKHFRHWPAPGNPDRYGRTYQLDAIERSRSAGLSFGVPEAVRPRIPLDQFADCIVIGTLTRDGCRVVEPDEAYLSEIGAQQAAIELIRLAVASI